MLWVTSETWDDSGRPVLGLKLAWLPWSVVWIGRTTAGGSVALSVEVQT
jgi:hypothetical protein